MRSLPLFVLLVACAAPSLDPEVRESAVAAERRADWPEAALLWSDLHRHSRGLEPEACRGLAVALWRGGATDAARRVLEPALERFPEDAELWRLAGEVALTEGRRVDALDAWERSVTLDPERLDLVLRIGELSLLVHDHGRVLDLVDPALQPPASRARAHLLVGRASASFDPARLGHFRAAFDGGEGTPEDRFAAARQSLEREGDLTEVVAWLTEVVRQRPQNSLAHRSLSEAWVRQGNLARAESAARRSAELEPDDPAAFAQLARVAWERQQPDEALAFLASAREREPDEELVEWLDAREGEWTADPELEPEPVGEEDATGEEAPGEGATGEKATGEEATGEEATGNGTPEPSGEASSADG